MRTLTLRYPWWLHPAWALALLTGLVVIFSVLTPDSTYAEMWRVPKFLDDDLSLTILVLMLVFFIALLLGSGTAARSGQATVEVTDHQARFLRATYRLTFALALVGYVIWVASAFAQGVDIAAINAILSRQEGAVSALKENSRPIAGVTTLTQLGPVVVAIGMLLRRIGEKSSWFWVLFVLAGARTLFYAERLALIEVALPALIISALTVTPGGRWSRLVRVAPLIAAPALWAVFAVSEYTRSWVYYEQFSDFPFHEWVTYRLLGYYTTSFNNSAMIAQYLEGVNVAPYFSIDGFWNAPWVAGFVAHPGIGGVPPSTWLATALTQTSNPEFNNPGSFLVTWAEFGPVLSILFWIAVGVAVGAVYARMTKGSIPALLSVAVLFVGMLELSRFIYWTQGRCFPLLVALIVIAFTYPQRAATAKSRNRGGTLRTRTTRVRDSRTAATQTPPAVAAFVGSVPGTESRSRPPQT